MPDPTEATTRRTLIDPLLRQAGWEVNDRQQVGLEIPVSLLREPEPVLNESQEGISDYALYRANGDIIAIVEAKRTSIDARLAETQARYYVTEIEKKQGYRPFAFMTNGYDIYFWDVGRENKRLVQGFFSPEDLESLLYLRENGLPLTATPIDTTITDRSYQVEAIRRVGEAFEQGKRKALLVMATGTGKTRVAMSLVSVFLRSNQARRILFVADRDALVTQALNEGFEDFIPDEPAMRLTSGTTAQAGEKRLFVVTLQTLSNIYRQFTPAFFDLIIFDEVHRSIFNKWNDVLQYFDARMVGLTATPAAFIDRNTFLEFECFDAKPTFFYSYEEAIRDNYLVDYTLYAAQTRFQRKGIRGVDLSEEERNLLIEQGIDPDELDYAGTDLEKRVSNRDTLRQQWQEIMDQCYKDESGQLPGKTIIFAMTQEHALRLAGAFAEMYPQFPDLAQVITYKSEYSGRLVDDFKKSSLPRIAISVDMLETGVNVPEVVNLVFMRPVQSRIKLEQMIGRGTRTLASCRRPEWLPNRRKDDFLIIDFWENDFSKTPQPELAQSLPVLVALFNTRLQLLEGYLPDRWSPPVQRTTADLRVMVERIPTDSFTVRRLWPEIQEAWDDAFWEYLTPARLDFLRVRVGPLLRDVPRVDVAAETFTHKVERLKLQILTRKDTTASVQAVAEDVSRLPNFVREEPERAEAMRLALSPGLATALPADLDRIVDTLADQMRFRQATPNAFLELDLPDFIDMRGYILLFGGAQEIYVERYRQLVEERILELVAGHPTIAAIERDQPVSDEQLLDLERTLRRELGGPGVELSEENIRKAYGLRVGSLMEFVRDLLELDGIPDYRDIVQGSFDRFIARQQFNADQTRFLRAVQSVFVRKRRLELPDLYEPPLTTFGADAADRLLTLPQIDELLEMAASLEVQPSSV